MFKHGHVPTIETERLLLRRLNHHDVAPVFQLYSDYDVVKYDGGITMEAYWQAEQFVTTFGNVKPLNGQRFVTWGLVEKASQRFIGVVGLKNWNGRISAEIGLNMMKGFWNHGYGKEAIASIVTYTFRTLRLNKIYALIMPQNRAAIRLFAKKLNFKFIRKITHYPYAHKYVDVYLYQLVNEGES